MSHENEPSNNHLEAEIITRKTGKTENKLSNRKSTAKPERRRKNVLQRRQQGVTEPDRRKGGVHQGPPN